MKAAEYIIASRAAKVAALEHAMRKHPEQAKQLADAAIAGTASSELLSGIDKHLTLKRIAETSARVLSEIKAAEEQAAKQEETNIDDEQAESN